MDGNGGTANGIAVDLYDSEARINGVGPRTDGIAACAKHSSETCDGVRGPARTLRT
jgi:hypothetical protein